MNWIKRILLGRPISTHDEIHQRLSKRIALAVFSSDALSSSAYATDEMLRVLMLAGVAALAASIPIAVAVAFVLIIVVASYRQTVRAYPQGGGAFIVTHENLGRFPGLIAASSLLTDYVLTVSVSVAAGVKAFGAAFPTIADHKLGIAIVVVVVITALNLRGIKESGAIFSIPTYGFLVCVGGMILYGLFRFLTGNLEPFPEPRFEPNRDFEIFLLLWAFASGSTALTGIEAIADGVPAFRRPEARNAATTLLTLGFLLTFLFIGITILGNLLNVDPALIEEDKTIPSQIAAAVFGAGSAGFYVIQFFTALILFLAANTAYADFPRLSSILARERYLPRVFQARGDRLAFSNGIALLALAATAVLIVSKADVHTIIPLYVVGVFTSFTLSQTGMIVRWRKLSRGPRAAEHPNWRKSITINAVGALTTFVVLIIVSITKFKPEDQAVGAWLIIILIPSLAWLLHLVRRHYDFVETGLKASMEVTEIQANRVVVLASPYPGATLKALSFARSFGPRELHVVAFRVPESRLRVLRDKWTELKIPLPIEPTGHRYEDLMDYIRGFGPTPSEPITVVLPDPQDPSIFQQLRKGTELLRIKGRLLYERGIVVVSVPFRPDLEADLDRLRAPQRLSILVPVSRVNRATMRALAYARSLAPTDLRAVMVSTDPGSSRTIAKEWEDAGIEVPLEILDSPYRSLIQPLIKEVRSLGPSSRDAVAVVIPEFVVTRWWQHLLHNQTALMLKFALLPQPNVMVISVPYRLPEARPKKKEKVEARTN